MHHEETGSGAPSWLAVDDLPPDDSAPPARSRTLYVAAAIPWLVVAVMILRPASPPSDPVLPDGPTVASPVGAPSPQVDGPVASPSELAPVTATITASGALVAVDEDEARAVAVVAARRWLTTVGPGAGGDEGSAGGVYAEHLVVEGVDHPAPGAAVVTVRALVLRVEGDRYGAVEVRRVAVPLRFDAGGAAPAGTPYLLPHEEPTPAALELEPITDPDLLLAAGEALAAAGFEVSAIHSLHRTTSWPLVVTADVGRGTGDAAPRRVAVWLRQHLGRLVVAGTRPGPPTPASPAPDDLPSSPGPGDDAGDDAQHDHEEVAP